MGHIIKGKEIIISLVFMCFGFTGLCLADTIYFKNGRKMEGDVRRTSEGLWIEGGLFQENEIERIEKGPSPTTEKDGQPWYNDILTKVGIKTKEDHQGTAKTPPQNPQASGLMNPAQQQILTETASPTPPLMTGTRLALTAGLPGSLQINLLTS